MKKDLITWQGDTVLVTGRIDERFAFARLGQVPPTRKLSIDVEHVESINSVGMRALIEFLKTRPSGSVELVHCTSTLLEALNALPSALKSIGHRDAVKSLFFPFECKACGEVEGIALEASAIKVEHDALVVPDTRCPNCRRQLKPAVDPNDHCMFLLY